MQYNLFMFIYLDNRANFGALFSVFSRKENVMMIFSTARSARRKGRSKIHCCYAADLRVAGSNPGRMNKVNLISSTVVSVRASHWCAIPEEVERVTPTLCAILM